MDVLIDYFKFSSKIHSLADIIELLGLESVVWQQGRARDGWTLHEYFSGMHIYHGGRDDVGVELSGAGCRMLETCNKNSFDWCGLFAYIMEYSKVGEMNVSRLDVAGDDKEGRLSLRKIIRYTSQGKYICKARRKVWIEGDEEEVIFGAPSSSTRLRIYNKALERGVDEPWVRVEFQLRDEAADSFILNLLGVGGEIGPAYSGVLLNYIRFTTRDPSVCSNNYERIPTASFWSSFCRFLPKAQKYSHRRSGVQYLQSRKFCRPPVRSQP